jgi:hypothetical protein
MENKINQNIAGLNLDSVSWQIKESQVTFAMNANIQSHDGNSTTYTNEPSNQVCFDFKDILPGFQIVGVRPIIEQERVMVFLTHPDGRSEIGFISNLGKDCETVQLKEEDCGCAAGTHVVATVVSSLIPIAGTEECPTGYTFNSKSGFCEKLINTPIQQTVTTEPVINSCPTAYHGANPPLVYDNTWTTKTPLTYSTAVAATLNQNFWVLSAQLVSDNYLKQIGIQADVNATYDINGNVIHADVCGTQETDVFLGFSETVCIN